MNVSHRLQQLLGQIREAAEKAGRDPASIQLIAVTKNATLEQMHKAYQLGIRHFGESRLQTALPKISQFPEDVMWHFIGSLQSNKLGKITEHFDFVHSVDSLEIAQQIAKKGPKHPQLFLQVNTSNEATKHGFSEAELMQQFDALLQLKLNLVGLMTMAPHTSDQEEIQRCFKALRQLRDTLASKKSLPQLSMGMTQDFSTAIAEGATFLRIGSALFM